MNSTLKIDRSVLRALTGCLLLLISSANVFTQNRGRKLQNPTSGDPVSQILLVRILRAEDERRWDDDLRGLFSARNANVRSRAALAAGRIGDPAAVADLVTLLRDDEPFVRAMAAFALGEVEDQSGANALLGTLKDTKDPVLRARAIEALGKLAAALPKEQESRSRELGSAILDTLKFEAHRPDPDRLTVLLGLTATLRAKPANAGPIVADFLRQSDPRVRADAANTLARLKLNDGNDQLRKLLTTDPDPVVRANAARLLGATTDKEAFPALVERATKDQDSRVRVSAVRALAALNDHEPRVADALASLWCERRLLERKSVTYHQRDQGCLDLITALGRAFQGTGDKDILMRVRQWGFDFSSIPPEVEIAMMRISPQTYLSGLGGEDSAKRKVQTAMLTDWHEASSLAQALGEVATLPDSTNNKKQLVAKAESLLGAMLDYKNSGLTINTLVAVHSEIAVPDALRAYAAFKPKDLGEVLRKHLKESDVIIRSTAADLIGELPPDDANTRALVAALPVALADKELDDAALSILDSLGKQKNATANDAIKTALDSQDHLVRRRAVALLKANGAGDFSSRIGVVKTQNTPADYERAIARIGKQITARVTTDKGSFTINLLPEDAPLNVDNFIQLANRKYFNGIRVHRVVPNFVIQDGDPRGDGNGGPGYQIRCEINEVPYERGAVGMALSGKDTGGSQWFVTHSPQPHLDGGYTVFGNVIAGMETVDAIVRGDVIRSIVITESAPPTAKRRAR